jgi:hypothetical protein
MMMDVSKILAELKAEREQIEEAILSLERLARGRGNGPGRAPNWMAEVTRPAGSGQPPPATAAAGVRVPRPRPKPKLPPASAAAALPLPGPEQAWPVSGKQSG